MCFFVSSVKNLIYLKQLALFYFVAMTMKVGSTPGRGISVSVGLFVVVLPEGVAACWRSRRVAVVHVGLEVHVDRLKETIKSRPTNLCFFSWAYYGFS
jgi:hypothetical protein